jgi:N-acetylglucosamine-6-sulfatase
MTRIWSLKTHRDGAPAIAVAALLLALATLGWFAATALMQGEDQASARRGGKPNVVVVMTDDQERKSVGVMRTVKRELADKGTTFKNAFATFPTCCPSRATYLTGKYAHNHGVMGNHPPNGGVEVFDDSRTLPIALKRAGYRTSYVGRYLNGYRGRKVPPGWSDWHVPIGRSAFRMYRYELNENGRVNRYGKKSKNYATDVYADLAASFIRRSSRGPKPFFLTLAPVAPHSDTTRSNPPNPQPARRDIGRFADKKLPRPRSFNEADVSDKPFFVRKHEPFKRKAIRGLERRYQDRLESLLAVDDAVDLMIDELREARELRDTLVVFTSDNGFMLGQHRLTAKNKFYEESAGVPLILSGPGVPNGVRRKQVVGNIDLAPTILDLAGARALRKPDGRSLLPLARKAGKAKGREILLENQQSAAVRTRRYVFADHAGEEAELYDLRRDPFELESRHDAPQFAGVRSRLEQRLEQLRNCAGASCR